MKRKIIACISDTHGGHKMGLCNPDTKLRDIDNGQVRIYSPQLSEIQKLMWNTYTWGKDEIIKLAGKDEIILIHNGDPTHGRAIFLQSITDEISDQILIAKSNLDPWMQCKNVKSVRFAVGTGIHEFSNGSASTLVSQLLRSEYPKVDTDVVYHGVLDIDGYKIDYAHHGPFTGSRKWLEGNQLRFYLNNIMISELMDGNTPPDMVIRGHYHVYKKEYMEMFARGEYFESNIIVLPGFTFKDDYTRKATRSEYIQMFGMVAFEILDGHLYRIHKFIKTVDLRTKEIT